jgi:RHS repeat-associated protein
MKTLSKTFGRAGVLGHVMLGLIAALLAASNNAVAAQDSQHFEFISSDQVGFRLVKCGDETYALQFGFECALSNHHDEGGAWNCTLTGDTGHGYSTSAGWAAWYAQGLGDIAEFTGEGDDQRISFIRLYQESLGDSYTAESLKGARDSILNAMHVSALRETHLLWSIDYAADKPDNCHPREVWTVVASSDCWCACICDPVADCGKPYAPFSVGPLSGTWHNGTAYGGQSTPPNTCFGQSGVLGYPQLLWTSSGSVNAYVFKHGAMETRAIDGIPGLPGGYSTVYSNGSALLWSYVAADDEYELLSKSRARMRFTNSGSSGYQHLDRIVAANGIDEVRYKWSGERPTAIYSNKVGGNRRKTAINYDGDGHITSVNENVVAVSGTWPDESETLLWSRTTTVTYVGSGATAKIGTITAPGNLHWSFAYEGDNLTALYHPYGHSQHWLYTDDKVTEYYENRALKNNRRTYAYDVVADFDENSPWSIFRTEVTQLKANGAVVGKTCRYHDGWRSRGHSTAVLALGGDPLARQMKVRTLKHGSARMVAGKTSGSQSENFFMKTAVSCTSHGSPTKVYAHCFTGFDEGDADESEAYVRTRMEYATPDAATPHFETLTKVTSCVGRETNALYWDDGADDSYRYNLKSVWLNDDSDTTVDYAYYGESDGDDNGLLKKVTSFDGTYAEYEYNDRRVSKVYAGPSSGTKVAVLEYEYNDGADPDIPYDAITGITDVNGKTTTFDCDVIGRVTAVTIPADGQGNGLTTWEYAYGTWGDYDALKVSVTRPDDKQVVYYYNPSGTLASVDAPDVGDDEMVTAFDYDNLGRLVKLMDAAGHETLWSYDSAGRVMTETIVGDGGATNVTAYGYNPDGQIAEITDPKGQTVEYAYDADDRLSSIVMTDAEQNETTKTILYSWDTDEKAELWTVSMGGESVAIKYNAYGLLEYVDGVLSGADANADKVSYAYDDEYKLTGLGYYIYDAQQSQYVLWTTSYAYDAFGRLETITDRLGRESAYAYNDDMTLKSLTLPNGTVTEYTYDDLRRLVSIATTGLSAGDIIAKFTYQYNHLGLRDKVTAADGRTTEWAYDDVGRLIEEHFKKPDATTLLRYVYAYDAAGNRTSKKTDYDADNGSFAATATYSSNGYNQLTAVTGSPGRGNKVNVAGTIPTAWTLANGDVHVTPNAGSAVDAEVRGRFFIARNVPLNDSASNSIVASTTATTLAGNTPSSDTASSVKLETSIDDEYTYNANGDLILKSEEGGTILWTYSYSVDGWLTKVDGPNGFVEQYWYDPIGRKHKTSTTEGQTTTRYFVYDGGSILLELDEDKELAKEFVRGLSLGGGIGGLLYTRAADGSLAYFHYDGQGNVVSVTDEAREELAYYEYDAWGNVLTACGDSANEFRFSTKQASLGNGLTDFGYRWYDPQAGRWTQRDIAGAINTYLYCSNSPPSRLDADGARDYPNDPTQDIISEEDLANAGTAPFGAYRTTYGVSDQEMGAAARAFGDTFTMGLYGLVEDSICVGKEYGWLAGLGYGAGSLVGVRQGLELAYNVDILSGQSLDAYGRAGRLFDIGVRVALFVKAARTPGDTFDECCAAGGAGDRTVHGNSLQSPKTNYGYALVDRDTGGILKFGETANPAGRYSQTWLDSMNARVKILTQGNKWDIHCWQHQKIVDYRTRYGVRPPLNRNDW